MNGIKLSGVVIAFNEEKKIERCIRSLFMVCDEVVVLDSYSNDQTCDLAKAAGAHVVQHEFDGHIQQKNRALTYAKFPYILSLDADEELSETLVTSILKIKQHWLCDAYSMNRLNRYGSQWIRHGAWYPDKKIRLWKQDVGQWGGDNPHDKFIVNPSGKIGHLRGNLLHYTVNGLEELKTQTEKFSSIAAQAMNEKNMRISRGALLFKALFRFIKEYIVLMGFLDGKAGMNIAIMNTKYVWLKYSKLSKLAKK